MSIAPRYALCKAARYPISHMKTVEEVRRLRLAELLTEYETLVTLNDRLGLNKRDSTLSQVLNSARNSKTGKPKEMGSALARRLEQACGKPVGWMDTAPGAGGKFSVEAADLAAQIDAITDPVKREEVLVMCAAYVNFITTRKPDPEGVDEDQPQRKSLVSRR